MDRAGVHHARLSAALPQPGRRHVVLGYNGKGVAFANRAGAWIARKLIGVPDSGDIPLTPIKPIPLHRFRAPMANVAMEWHRLMDFLGR